jgi:tetratricopeptide (TPR) repeat protein
LLVVAVGNLHSVAESFEEAAKNPYWLASEPPRYVERKATGNEQWKYAIDTWGSRGTKQWKKEANAFQAVSLWFPDDRTSAAKAKLGLVVIYHYYLRDYRRAIVAARELRHMYPDQGEQCASALSHEGWSYYMLKDFNNSRKAFIEVIKHYFEYAVAMKSAQKGIKWLNSIGHNK